MIPILLALCVVGLYVSARMQAKAVRFRRGELAEDSVVKTERATVIASVPNSAIGIAYYALLGVASLFLQNTAIHVAAVIAASLAAAMSLYLAYSLLFATRMPCAFCWTGHVVNWLLLAVLLLGHP